MRDTGGSRELAGYQASSVLSKMAQGHKAEIEQGTPNFPLPSVCVGDCTHINK